MKIPISRAAEIYKNNGTREMFRAGRDWLYNNGFPVAKTNIFGLPLVDDWCYKRSNMRLQRLMEAEQSFADSVETVNKYQGYGNYKSIKPMQGIEPLKELFNRVAEAEPETVVEIGTARGGTFYLMVRFFNSANQFVSVNLGWSFGYKYKKQLLKGIDPSRDLNFITGNSHDQSTYDEVNEATKSEVDFMFIDGDHSYRGVKQDFEMYRGLMSDGGIIAFHDIQHEHPRVGVGELWKEIKRDYKTEEIGVSPERTTGGIGLVYT